MRGTATAKSRLTTIDSLIGGTTRRPELVDCSVQIINTDEMRAKAMWCISLQHLVCYNSKFVLYS